MIFIYLNENWYFEFFKTIKKIEKAEKTEKSEKGEKVKKHLKKVAKEKKIKTTKGLKKDLEELVNLDGALSNSKIPILDPKLHPQKTMDQTVRATRTPKPPYTGTYRVYYGESTEEEPTIQEVDYSDAYGYEETEDLDGKETFDYLKNKMEMEPEEAYNRTKQFGKDPSGKRDKNSKYYKDKNFITKATLSEIDKQRVRKMIEDIMSKKTDDHELSQKTEASALLKRNIKALRKMSDKEGLSLRDLLTLIKNEQ